MFKKRKKKTKKTTGVDVPKPTEKVSKNNTIVTSTSSISSIPLRKKKRRRGITSTAPTQVTTEFTREELSRTLKSIAPRADSSAPSKKARHHQQQQQQRIHISTLPLEFRAGTEQRGSSDSLPCSNRQTGNALGNGTGTRWRRLRENDPIIFPAS